MKRARVLVVDDELEVTLALTAYFQKKDYEMLMAFDGAQAIAHLTERPVDLLLLDMRMPGVNGIEVIQHVRSRRMPTRIIVITAFDDEYRALVGEMGVHGFLNKPFGIEALTRTIEEALGQPPERTLPVEDLEEATSPAIAVPRAKLLFVESSEYLFNVKRVFFESPERCGGEYQVAAAYSEAEALEQLRAFKPDMVLVDLIAVGALGDLASQLLRSPSPPREIIVHGHGTVSRQQKQEVATLTDQRQVQLVLNETFTQAGLKRLNNVIRRVALQQGFAA